MAPWGSNTPPPVGLQQAFWGRSLGEARLAVWEGNAFPYLVYPPLMGPTAAIAGPWSARWL